MPRFHRGLICGVVHASFAKSYVGEADSGEADGGSHGNGELRERNDVKVTTITDSFGLVQGK